MRVLLGAFGDPGHAFPMLALGAELLARGHEVGIETWKRWREPAEAAGMTFAAAPEYQVFPTRERPLKPYEAAVLAAQTTRAFVRVVRARRRRLGHPHARAGARRRARGRAGGDAVPHVYPGPPAGLPAVLDRRAAAAHAARARAVEADLPAGGDRARAGPAASTTTAARGSGSPPLPYVHTGLSRSLTMVGTFPQLEYPRAWPPWQRVVGPLLWEPGGPRSRRRRGDGPVVLVATVDVAGPVAPAAATRAWTAWRTSRCG